MTSTVELPTAETAEVSLLIGGMTCGACAARIERRLNLLDGVEARVNYASERATAVFPVDVPVERLIAEVAAAGYSAALPPQEIWKLVAYIQSLGGTYSFDGTPRNALRAELVAPELDRQRDDDGASPPSALVQPDEAPPTAAAPPPPTTPSP